MSESPLGNLEIVPSSKVLIENRQKSVDRVAERYKRQKEEYLKKIKPIEIDLQKEKTYSAMIELVVTDIKEKYLSAGISLGDDSFADIHLVQDNEQAQNTLLSLKPEPGIGGYDQRTNQAYVVAKGGDYLLEDIEAIYHELFHSVGRKVGVALESSNVGGMLGHKTYSLNIDESRGKVLEEGSALYFSKEFALNSQHEIVKQARVSYVEANGDLVDKDIVEKSKKDGLDTEKLICRVGLSSRLPSDYFNSEQLVNSLIWGTYRNLGVEDASLIQKELLSARIDSKQRFKMGQRIDGAFGKGTANSIYKLQQTKSEDIEQVISKLS